METYGIANKFTIFLLNYNLIQKNPFILTYKYGKLIGKSFIDLLHKFSNIYIAGGPYET